MGEKKIYRIIDCNSKGTIEDKINVQAKKGFVCIGSLSVIYDSKENIMIYTQLMERDEDYDC